ncbi:MAG: Mrp/NBP35 family ATP-binding protein [Actinobacteria bacterium]|nr:Mrp/NBP35 family ATP-binding protein [Actinomycetota bacterium]
METVMGLLRGVVDPELGSDIVELGMAKGASVDTDGTVHVTVALTTSGCPLRAEIQRDVRARIGSLPGVSSVKIDWTELDQAEKAAAMERARRNMAERPEQTAVPMTARVVMVASGKGGVGKSSVTVNLATALAAKGFTVGVIDADIWGFSVPRMVGLDGHLRAEEPGSTPLRPATTTDGRPRIVPNELVVGDGRLKVVSMGFLVDDEGTALMWRGLMLNRAVQHFLQDVAWDDIDYLLIDMPPGTGDVQMGLARMLPRAQMLVVTTPSLTAQKVAVRVVDMGRKNFLHIVGVIENMSSYVDDTGREHRLFGTGGGERLAHDAGVPLLARIPIEPAVAEGGDHGRPAVLGEGPAAEAFRALAERIVDDVIPPADHAGCSLRALIAQHVRQTAPA